MTLEAIRFRPHFVVFDDGLVFPPEAAGAYVLVISAKKGMAIANVGGRSWKLEDMSIDDLLGVADAAEKSILGRTP